TAFIAIYILAVSLSLPGGLFLTISGGLLFGAVIGGAGAVGGGALRAAPVFLLARRAFCAYIPRRARPPPSQLGDGFCANAFSYLLFLRLVPVFPFFLVNLAPALVGVRVATFVAATAIGIIPATFVFASVGAGLDSVIQAQAATYLACLNAGRADCH